jgi:hypothetical protein
MNSVVADQPLEKARLGIAAWSLFLVFCFSLARQIPGPTPDCSRRRYFPFLYHYGINGANRWARRVANLNLKPFKDYLAREESFYPALAQLFSNYAQESDRADVRVTTQPRK